MKSRLPVRKERIVEAHFQNEQQAALDSQKISSPLTLTCDPLDVPQTFPNYDFGKGQYAFYPVKLSRFAEKNKVRLKYQNFMKGGP